MARKKERARKLVGGVYKKPAFKKPKGGVVQIKEEPVSPRASSRTSPRKVARKKQGPANRPGRVMRTHRRRPGAAALQ